jgi:hypothetical protein
MIFGHASEKHFRKAFVTGINEVWLINLDRRRDRLEAFMQAHPEMTGRVNRLPACLRREKPPTHSGFGASFRAE